MGTSRVYAVASGKGGVGKTTTAVNLGAGFVEAGRSVVVVDVDLGMANLADVLDVDEAVPTLHDVLGGDVPLEASIQPAPGEFDVIAGSPDFAAFGRADPAGLGDVVADLREQYDVVLLDTGGGLSYDTALPLALADEVVLVTTPDEAALSNTGTTWDLVEELGAEVTGVVVTRIGGQAGGAPDDVAARLDLTVLGSVPEDSTVAESATDGIPVVTADRTCPAAQSYRELAFSMLGEPLPRDWADDETGGMASAPMGAEMTNAPAEDAGVAGGDADDDDIIEAGVDDSVLADEPDDGSPEGGAADPTDAAVDADTVESTGSLGEEPDDADDILTAEPEPVATEAEADDPVPGDEAPDDGAVVPEATDEMAGEDAVVQDALVDEVDTDADDFDGEKGMTADEAASDVDVDEPDADVGDSDSEGGDSTDDQEAGGPGIADAIESAESDPDAATVGGSLSEAGATGEDEDDDDRSLLSKVTGGLFG